MKGNSAIGIICSLSFWTQFSDDSMAPQSPQNENEIQSTSADMDRLQQWFSHLHNSKNYNRNLKSVVPIFASKERCVFEMPIDEESVNGYGTLHGAATMALLDVLTAITVMLSVPQKNVLSVDMSASYMLPVSRGDTVEVTTNVLRIGRTTAFVEAEFRRKSDGRVAAKGRQTLALVDKQPPKKEIDEPTPDVKSAA
ncbi:unnamed protein product, partial [Mesorhabditis belari]|uniref:Thioesterase domain-containing protein n=1 Tax=Mesorhabditis belari TaxID=2138241 RepID=A0AAF3FMG8_9BILA